LQGCSVFDARSICVPSNRSAVNLLALNPCRNQQGIYSTETGAALRLPKRSHLPEANNHFSDHDNLSNAAAAAPAPESEPAPNSANPETNATVESAAEPVARPTSEPAEAVNAAQETPAASASEEAKPAAETHAADPETTAAAEEAAGSEEMSKLLEEYDEKQEAAASSEVIEVKVVRTRSTASSWILAERPKGWCPRRNSRTRRFLVPSRTA